MPDPTDAMRRAAREYCQPLGWADVPSTERAHLAGQQQGRADAVAEIVAWLRTGAQGWGVGFDGALDEIADAIDGGEWAQPNKAEVKK